MYLYIAYIQAEPQKGFILYGSAYRCTIQHGVEETSTRVSILNNSVYARAYLQYLHGNSIKFFYQSGKQECLQASQRYNAVVTYYSFPRCSIPTYSKNCIVFLSEFEALKDNFTILKSCSSTNHLYNPNNYLISSYVGPSLIPRLGQSVHVGSIWYRPFLGLCKPNNINNIQPLDCYCAFLLRISKESDLDRYI